MEVGLNYMGSSPESTKFQKFKDDGLHLSFRLYWNQIEPTRGAYTISAYKSLLDMAELKGLKVNITFWNQFQSGAEIPSWAKSLYGSSPFIIAEKEAARTDWLNMMKWVVNQLKGYTCIDSWCPNNEPYYNTTAQRDGFIALFPLEHSAIHDNDPSGRPVVGRFTNSHCPASGKYPDSVYDLFDIMSINVYNHYDTYPQADAKTDPYVYNSKWWMFKDTVADCKARAKRLWITEFGCASSNAGWGTITDSTWTAHYKAVLKTFSDMGIERAYAWAWRQTSASSEAFNLWNGSTIRPAYNELLVYSGPEPTNYTLTIQAPTGMGSVNPTVGQYNYTVGFIVTISESPSSGWQFEHFVLDSNIVTAPGDTLAIVMNSDHVVKAVFSEIPIPPSDCQEYIDQIAILQNQITVLQNLVTTLNAQVVSLNQKITNAQAALA